MKAAFATNLGTCTITRAEMNGVIDGMKRPLESHIWKFSWIQ
ncbi:hypothetical protein LINGRAHAP2_LOCUS16135 [Linum grandiflorum]